MQRRIAVTEHQRVVGLSAEEVQLTRARLAELSTELKPRTSFLGLGSDLVIRNLVGSVQVSRDLVLDVAPNVPHDVNWTGALIDLLTPTTRVGFGGESREAQRHPVRVLPDALAELYCRQLDRALRREGPLTVIQGRCASTPSLRGRLDVTRWVTERTLKPAHFPHHHTGLTVENPFTDMLAAVAVSLASSCSNPRTTAALRSVAERLRPGLARHVALDPSVALRDLPSQWRAYVPAWATARSVVRRVAPLRRHGHLEGLGVALEPWPLLEALLERALKVLAGTARESDPGLAGFGHTGWYPLRQPTGTTSPGTAGFHVKGGVDPDGILKRGGEVVATFEAKYTTPTKKRIRAHAFQALAAAAALGAPVAVLVYPTSFEPVTWDLTGFHGQPRTLAAVGLDMYGYESGVGDEVRAKRLYRAVSPTDPCAPGHQA